MIILEGCTVELAEEETEVRKIFQLNFKSKLNAVIWQVYAFKIQFHGDGKTMGRTYSLGTQTMEDLEQWMKLVRFKKIENNLTNLVTRWRVLALTT